MSLGGFVVESSCYGDQTTGAVNCELAAGIVDQAVTDGGCRIRIRAVCRDSNRCPDSGIFSHAVGCRIIIHENDRVIIQAGEVDGEGSAVD